MGRKVYRRKSGKGALGFLAGLVVGVFIGLTVIVALAGQFGG